jgi:hypothetical protein
VDDSPGRRRILRLFYVIKKILIRNFIWNFNCFCNNIWTVVCVILTHLNAVWQFRQIQAPEDGHIGPKHVLNEGEGEKIKICCITDGIDIHRLFIISSKSNILYKKRNFKNCLSQGCDFWTWISIWIRDVPDRVMQTLQIFVRSAFHYITRIPAWRAVVEKLRTVTWIWGSHRRH